MFLAGARAEAPIRYAAIGDSYSIGEGAQPGEAWPAVLAGNLRKSGLPVELVANPSVTGWTAEQALAEEIPVYATARPTFATLQIGVNDWVSGAPAGEFRRRLERLLDAMIAVLPDKDRLLVVNIPDFSATPTGLAYARGRDVKRGLTEYNEIIAAAAKARGLRVVDVFPLSQRMAEDPSLIAEDGLHPSAKEYAEWEKRIFPVAREVLIGQAK